MGEKKKAGKLEPFAPESLFIENKSPVTVCTIGLYSHNDKKNYKNQQKQLIITRTKCEEIKNGNKKQNFKRTARTVCKKWTLCGRHK